ncbi:PEP-utilizing enzyme [Amycolatopsis sp. NBC_01307]|uniref:putative PEP-binding protein n=1 Tax=Amycolatopsis sp. NBC_01307 TaxID=2903561 RepID=UPI002E125B89|nr:PEP-utilizing enzyme [Amycolatopsis sp. NBC_01307]
MSTAHLKAVARLLLDQTPEAVLSQAAPRAVPLPGTGPVITGLGVVLDCASGVLCIDAESVAAAGSAPYVYARLSTNASDMAAAGAAVGLLTAMGGGTSHAAVLARSWRKPCVVGAGFDLRDGVLVTGDGTILQPGEQVTVCATTGTVWRGALPRRRDPDALAILANLDKSAAALEELPGPTVYANADTDEEAEVCFGLGARGVGVARTEHMFFGVHELPLLRQVLWPTTEHERSVALAGLEERLIDKCAALMTACRGRRLTIRLLDPPVHEFAEPADLVRVREQNPMMGVRGGRLGVLHPDIYRMQARAISRAHSGLPPERRSRLAVLLPFVNFDTEVHRLREVIDLPGGAGIETGVMIETPEAIFRVREIAAQADFLSVGSNDLIQFCLAMSRDDVATSLLPAYVAEGLISDDPMMHLEQSASAIGLLRIMADTLPDIPWGICGEHAADPSSLRALLGLGPTYVSASAAGVQSARLEIGLHRAKQLLGQRAVNIGSAAD